MPEGTDKPGIGGERRQKTSFALPLGDYEVFLAKIKGARYDRQVSRFSDFRGNCIESH